MSALRRGAKRPNRSAKIRVKNSTCSNVAHGMQIRCQMDTQMFGAQGSVRVM